MRSVLFTVILFCFGITVNAQSVRNFLIPDNPNSRAYFYTPKEGGVRPAKRPFLAEVYDYSATSSGFSLTSMSVMGDMQPDVKGTIFYECSTSEAVITKMIKIDGNNVREEFISPPVVFLQLPAKEGEVIETRYADPGSPDKRVPCFFSIVTVNVNGVQKKAIKRVTGFNDNQTAEYYVEGIGFWKSEKLIYGKYDQTLTELYSLEPR